MQCIKSSVKIEESIKKSRFIACLYPCQNEAEVANYLQQLRIEHASANHIVFAYRIKTETGIICRFNDDGEPSGTAAKPIFKYLEGHELINVLCVVVRYFGGIKLGAGGLTRAYGNTAKQAIEAAKILPYIELATLSFVLDYNQLQLFEYKLKQFSGVIINKEFTGQITLLVQLPESQVEQLTAVFPAGIVE